MITMKFASTSALTALALLISACFSEADVPLAGEWRVESVGESTRPFAMGEAILRFDDGKLSAYAGCNRMGGNYNLRGGVIRISQMMATRMACVPAEKMQHEQSLAEALAKVTHAEVEGDKASLSGADGVVIVLWRKP